MVEGAQQGTPSPEIDAAAAAELRRSDVRDAEPIGSVPPPASLKGVAKAAGQMLTGKKPLVLIDKLSQRLAFERTGSRMYENFLTKLEAAGAPDGISIAEVRRFHQEELEHMAIVARAIEGLGGDPTVQTPSADVDGVASIGLLQVIADPRTSALQALHAIHVAELADNDGWAMLVDLVRAMGHEDMARDFTRALEQEHVHLATVRSWMAAGISSAAGVDEDTD
jgi:hypothetical protein